MDRKNAEEGGNGVVVFFCIVIVLGIIGGVGWWLRKQQLEKEGKDGLAYDNLGSGMTADGLSKAGDRVLPNAPTHDVE